MIKLKSLALLFLLIFLSLKLPKHYFRWTKGFRLSCCETELMNQPEWDKDPPNNKLKEVFTQPFFLYQRGSQAYVFKSQDGQYVLKIFTKPLRKYVFPYQLRLSFMRAPQDPYLQLTQKAVQGYSLGSKLPQEATGLVYLHLNTTKNLLPAVSLRDAFGRFYQLPLDSYRFVLQRTCRLLAPALKKATPQETERLIESYLQAISFRASLGIRNVDTEFKRNFGILDGRVIELDCGEFTYDLEKSQDELSIFSNRLAYWIDKHRPENGSLLEEKLLFFGL